MPSPIVTYQLDKTGVNPLNLVSNEQHVEIDSFSKILIPKHGRYFKESIVVKNSSNVTLVKDVDYVTIDYDQKNSLKYGKEICGGVIITTAQLSLPYTVTYQAFGGDTAVNRKDILDTFDALALPDPAIQWEEVMYAPEGFKAKPHLHDIREVYGFEYITRALLRIKNAIETTSFPSYQALVSFMDHALDKIKVEMQDYLDDNMTTAMNNFIASVDKKYLDLDNLGNFPAAKEADGLIVGKKNYLATSIVLNKYITTDALVGLKKVFFEAFVTKQSCNIGNTKLNYGIPLNKNIVEMNNQSALGLISQSQAREETIKVDSVIYPTEVLDAEEFIIQKVSNSPDKSGAVMIGFNPEFEDFYLGRYNIVTGQPVYRWTKSPTDDEITKLIAVTDAHSVDYGNPHDDTQSNIGLGLLENLPVVSKEEILGLKSTRKYLTFDGLMYFMRAFLLQNGKQIEIAKDNQNKFLIDNCIFVYTPAGVACVEDCNPPPPTTTAPPTTAPPTAFSKVSQACSTDSTPIPLDPEDPYSGTIINKKLTGVYNIGTGTNFTQVITDFSYCCGYRESQVGMDIIGSGVTDNYYNVPIQHLPEYCYYSLKIIYPNETIQPKMSGIKAPGESINVDVLTGRGVGTINNVCYHKLKNEYELSVSWPINSVGTLPPREDKLGNAYLYIPQETYYSNEIANCELFVTKERSVTATSFDLVWKRQDGTTIVDSALPSTLATTANAFIATLSFPLPAVLKTMADGFYVYVTASGSAFAENSNKVAIKYINQVNAEEEKTVPLFSNNTDSGTVTLSRNSITGKITIKNITIPAGTNSSKVYFLRSGLASSSSVVGVVDVQENADLYNPPTTPTPAPTTGGPPSSSSTPPPTSTVSSTPPPSGNFELTSNNTSITVGSTERVILNVSNAVPGTNLQVEIYSIPSSMSNPTLSTLSTYSSYLTGSISLTVLPNGLSTMFIDNSYPTISTSGVFKLAGIVVSTGNHSGQVTNTVNRTFSNGSSSTPPPSSTSTAPPSSTTTTPAPTTSAPPPSNMEKPIVLELVGQPAGSTVFETTVTLRLIPSGKLQLDLTGWINLTIPGSTIVLRKTNLTTHLEFDIDGATSIGTNSYELNGTYTQSDYNLITNGYHEKRAHWGNVWRIAVEEDQEGPNLNLTGFSNKSWPSAAAIATELNEITNGLVLTAGNHFDSSLNLQNWMSISNNGFQYAAVKYVPTQVAPAAPSSPPTISASAPTDVFTSSLIKVQMQNLHMGELYVFEVYGRRSQAGPFERDPSFTNARILVGNRIYTGSGSGTGYRIGYKKFIVPGTTDFNQFFNLENLGDSDITYNFYFVIYKKDTPTVKFTSNTIDIRIPPPPTTAPPQPSATFQVTIPLGNNTELRPPHNGFMAILLRNINTTQRYIIEYYFRKVSSAGDTGYVLNLPLDDIFTLTHFAAGTSTLVSGFPMQSRITTTNLGDQNIPAITFEPKPGVTTDANGITVNGYVKFYAENNPGVVYSTFGEPQGMINFTYFNN